MRTPEEAAQLSQRLDEATAGNLAMIDKVLAFVVDRLDTMLQSQDPRSEPRAIMGRLGGAESAATENKIIVSIANIERETTQRPANRGGPPPLDINLFILVAANFSDDYAEALKALSAALAFFQSSPVMTPATSPGFPAGIERLTIEFVNMSLQEANNLWTIRGSLYLPSFLLKLRATASAGP
jgi:Pvc16 N-terminal domain